MSLQRRINKRASNRTPTHHKDALRAHTVRTAGMTSEQINKSDKGQLNGSCNRTACQAPHALWFNTSTRAYYCAQCADDITRFTRRVDGFDICFQSTGDVTDDAKMKFGLNGNNR